MLQELLALVDTLEFEESGGVGVIGANFGNDRKDLELLLEVRTGEDGVIQNWKATCRSVRASHIVLGASADLTVTDSHVLLLPFTGPARTLWFSRGSADTFQVIGELWHAHHTLLGHWFPFTQFVNCWSDLYGLIEGGHGMLAEGPEPLMLAYQAVLQRHGFTTSVTSRESDRNHRAGVPLHQLIALIIGNLHVVAARIDAQRLN